MSAVGNVTAVCQQQLEKLIQDGMVYGVPWYEVLITAALDLNNDKTKISRVEAIDAMIKHLQEYREDFLKMRRSFQDEEQGNGRSDPTANGTLYWC